MMTYLAEFTATEVGTLIGTVILALVGGGVLGKRTGKVEGKAEGKAEAMQIGPQPFIVQLREEFATRRELEKVEATMNGHVAEMKASAQTAVTKMESLFQQTMTAMSAQTTATTNMIERRHKTTMEEIGKVAQGAYHGRQKLWEQVNDQREDLAAVKATSDVAGQIGKLAEALVPSATKVQPTHHSNKP